ncbi:MAG: hypothetical protein NTW07_06365 [candidate division Zixibacteria bacterium]|nr:hypothetical protein [candidate division Zixibacteria bacterium]
MRCHEARKRIDVLDQNENSPYADTYLQDHLDICEDCRKYAVLSGAMERMIATARVDDTVAMKPMEQQRSEIESRLKSSPDTQLRTAAGVFLRTKRPFYKLPALRLGVAAATVVLVALVFVPFSYYQTVGYDLNLQGVSRHLAYSDEQICELLSGLGLIEVGVDVKGCEATCSLAIFGLKTETEANMVAGAIARLSEPGLTTSIVPIRARSTRNLLEQANELIRRGDS